MADLAALIARVESARGPAELLRTRAASDPAASTLKGHQPE